MYDNVQHATSLDPVRNVLLKGDMPYTTCESISKYLNALAKDVTPSSSSQNLNYFGYNRALGSAKLLEYLGYGNFYKYAYSKDATWKTDPLVSNLELNLYGVLAYQKIYADHIRDSQWERVSPSTFNVDYLDGSNMFVDEQYSPCSKEGHKEQNKNHNIHAYAQKQQYLTAVYE